MTLSCLASCVTQVSMTFKNQQVLKDCSWEVKKGERVGLVGEQTGTQAAVASPHSDSFQQLAQPYAQLSTQPNVRPTR